MQEDALAVEAVREGDRERYGELIGRYQQLVYAIAWSRLGDADLSEDVAQETFVQAYRYLATLRRPERFGAWVARIARNTAAAVVRRSVRERKGLRQWQLEQPAAEPAKTDEAGEAVQDTLREALAALPQNHRECLVLYYMEGRSQEECARLLGIGEGAFRVRLHRARAVLRKDLERRMEESLAGLRPRPDLSRRVMAMAPAMPLLAKTFKLPFVGFLMAMVFVFAQMFAYWELVDWLERFLVEPAESERAFWRRFASVRTLAAPVVPIVILMAIWWTESRDNLMMRWLLYQMMYFLGVGAQIYLLSIFLPPTFGVMIAIAITSVIVASLFFFNDFSAPLSWGVFVLSLGLLASGRLRQAVRPKMGESPFLLGDFEVERAARPIAYAEMQRFVGMLSNRGVISMALIKLGTILRGTKEIVLYLPGVEPYFRTEVVGVHQILSPKLFLSRVSKAVIRSDGTVSVQVSNADARALEQMHAGPFDREIAERRVARRFKSAMSLFVAGDADGAMRMLGASGETMKPQAGARKLLAGQRVVYGVLITVAFLFFQFGVKLQKWDHGLGRPVDCREAVAMMSGWAAAAGQSGEAEGTIFLVMNHGARVPRAEDFNPQDRERIKKAMMARLGGARGDTTPLLSNEVMVANALESGLVSMKDLEGIGLTGEAVRRQVARAKPKTCAAILEVESPYMKTPHAVTNWELQSFAARLEVMNALGCLDLIDADRVARAMASHQCAAAERKRVEKSNVPGLFVFGEQYKPMEPTYYALRILKSLGRLDLIDRKACADGILHFYVGHGQFRTRLGEEVIVNGEDDRYFALESLVVLGEMGRIKDLKYWDYYYWSPPDEQADPKRNQFARMRLVEYCAFKERLGELRADLKR